MKSSALRVRLKPADPFDLIRLLARSQSDPRKAVAELVQNSLDAGATEVTVTRFRKAGTVALSILDNGAGVLAELGRAEALQHIATHIGHSYKKHLTPEERLRLLQQGKYGIGLLGFWCVGRRLEIHSRVGGSEVWTLRLEEDRPDGTVEKAAKTFEPTWTEVLIRELHPAAQRILTGRKLADYLAFELRGQLLQRETKLRVIDRLARGVAQKDFPVRPKHFQGVPLAIEAPHLRIELYYLPEEHGPGRVTLAAAGTVVSEDLAELGPPWNGGRLTGIVDAPYLDVAPGTRRGAVPNANYERFVEELRPVAERVEEWLARFEAQRAREADQALHARLRQVFRDLRKRLPHLELFPVPGQTGPGEAPIPVPAEYEPSEPPELYTPGPLASVRISPTSCRLAVGAEKRFQARALDESGRAIREDVSFEWSVPEGLFRAEAVGGFTVSVTARQGDRVATAEARVEVLEELEAPERQDIGIPEPVEVRDPGGAWRSRARDGRWEFNASHPDYLLAAGDPAKRFRYLATLLAKEIVLRQVAGGAAEDRLLEQLVEILAAVEDRMGRAAKRAT